MKDHPEATDVRKREGLKRIVNLYETWHAAEPDTGHDAEAAQWRAVLEGTEGSRDPGIEGKGPALPPGS